MSTLLIDRYVLNKSMEFGIYKTRLEKEINTVFFILSLYEAYHLLRVMENENTQTEVVPT